jgi:glutathione synthase/RimK-type ligase-like ATP-grasp enzyme
MLDLESTGVPIVPTTLLRRAAQPGLCAQIDIAHDFEIVVKPTVGLNAIGVRRGQAGDPAMLQHVTNLLTTGDVLLQPFVADVTVSGEVSLVYVDGAYSHAVRKQPAASDYRVQDSYGGAVMLHMPAKAEFDVAEAALAAAPEPALYARVDLVQYRGAPVVMELELIEPELFLRYSPQAILPLALAIKARVS